jgi:hypothetical protein
VDPGWRRRGRHLPREVSGRSVGKRRTDPPL